MKKSSNLIEPMAIAINAGLDEAIAALIKMNDLAQRHMQDISIDYYETKAECIRLERELEKAYNMQSATEINFAEG